MITLNKIPAPTAHIWFNDQYLGEVNEYEFNDLRIQIVQEQATGYWVAFEGERLDIQPSGCLSRWPIGLFSIIEKQLGELVKMQLEKYRNSKKSE